MKKSAFLIALLLLTACQKSLVLEDPVQKAVTSIAGDMSADITSVGNDGETASDQEFYVRGYAEVELADDPSCQGDDCPLYKHVFFRVMESDNEKLQSLLDKNRGNSDEGIGRVALGCAEDDGLIHYLNDSTLYGHKSFELGADLTETIVSSGAEKLIRLKLVQLVGGLVSDFPACYSHFTAISPY